MEVLNIVENADGSENWTIELTEEENNLLVQYAVKDIIQNLIINLEKQEKSNGT